MSNENPIGFKGFLEFLLGMNPTLRNNRADQAVAAAARLIADKEYGYMVAVKNNDITKVPLAEVAGKLKTVDPESSMIREAKMVGISFGDE